MNNNTKLFGVLVAALFAFGAIGTSAQTGFSNFVELGDWEYDIGDANVHDYCAFDWASTDGTSCVIYTTNADADYSKGDLYLGVANGDADKDVEEGFVRIFNTHGFDAGTLVQDGDADEGAAVFETAAELSFIESVNDNKLQNQELGAFFVSENNSANDTVQEDDLYLAEGERIDDDHDLIGAVLKRASWTVVFADLDGGGASDHDENEPLFANIDGSTNAGQDTVTVGDLVLSGDGFFTLVTLDSPYLANPGLIDLNVSSPDTYFLAILDEQRDYNDNGYRGEDILLVRNATGQGLDAPRVGEYSYVLTGDRQGELVKDGHPFHEEKWASIIPGVSPPGATGENVADANNDDVVFCALVGDADDDPATFMSTPFIHFDDATCSGNDADAGDVDLAANDVLSSDREGELTGFGLDAFDGAHWKVLDLNNDGNVDEGEPIVLDIDDDDVLESLDLVITEDGAFFAGPGYGHMAPNSLYVDHGTSNAAGTNLQLCTYYEEEEDENGNDIWVAHAVVLRAQYWTTTEGGCTAEEDVLQGDFVLAGNMHVGEFLTEETADDFSEGEYSVETGAGQSNYTVLYDDLFPSGFGPEDVVFLVESGKPKLDEESFYLGGPSVADGDDYYFTDTDDLVEFGSDAPFVLIEGDNRTGLSETDWFYLTFDGSIDDETLILYKVGGIDGEEPTPTPTTTATPTPTTTATPTTTPPEEQPTKKQPGFEAVALVAALGAALVLVRRRN